jgi:hypothetical protein
MGVGLHEPFGTAGKSAYPCERRPVVLFRSRTSSKWTRTDLARQANGRGSLEHRVADVRGTHDCVQMDTAAATTRATSRDQRLEDEYGGVEYGGLP